jgi:RNA polymerase sigma factor (sigma-70 family)
MSPGIPTRLLATQSDERLLALVRQGHERAFEAIVHRYRRPLLGYCRRLRLEDARAEDIVQLALLKTWIAVRDGSEVRDLKAWLYRVVHNTAVNALRDSVHDGQPLLDPTQGSRVDPRTDDSQLDRGMAMREALAEVAALPPLQREVIVRTAVAGHSHEQVASDLGITNGAVRGLLYRARTTLRTGVTALTPPPLLGWLAGRSNRGGPAPERLAELAGGGGAAVGVGGAGAAGVSGLLLKGGAVALTVGTVITGAAVVHLSASTPHRRHRLIASAASSRGAGAGSTATGSRSAGRYGELSATAAGAGAHRGNSGRRAGRGAGSGGGKARGTPSGAGERGSAGATTVSGGHAPRLTTRVTGGAHDAPAKTPAEQSPAPNPTPGSSPAGGGSGGGSVAGSGQGGGSGESGSGSGGPVGSGSGGPVGSAAGSGSSSGSDTSGSSGSSSGGSSEGAASGSGQSGSGSGSEAGAGSSESSGGGGSSGSSSGSSGSESSGEQSGSLVGTVVHEVGSILEHLLH